MSTSGDFLGGSLTERLGWTFLHFVWQGAAVAACGNRPAYARAPAMIEALRATPAPAMAAGWGTLLVRITRLFGLPLRRRTCGSLWLAGAGAAAALLTVGPAIFSRAADAPAPATRPADGQETSDDLVLVKVHVEEAKGERRRVVSEPALLCRNGQAGDIFVGAEVPMPADRGAMPVGPAHETAGLTVAVIPTLLDGGRILVKTRVSFSQKTDTKTDTGPERRLIEGRGAEAVQVIADGGAFDLPLTGPKGEAYTARIEAKRVAPATRPVRNPRAVRRGDEGAAVEVVPGGVLRVEPADSKDTFAWRWAFVPDTPPPAGRKPLGGHDFPGASSGLELLASPDGKYLAVVSDCEACWFLSVFDLGLILSKGEFKECAGADAWPGAVEMVKWEEGLLLIESPQLLTFQRGDNEVPILFPEAQRFAVDPSTGRVRAVSDGARDPVRYFTWQLRTARGGEKEDDLYYATIALAQLRAVESLPALRAELAARSDADDREVLQLAIDRLTAVRSAATRPATALVDLP